MRRGWTSGVPLRIVDRVTFSAHRGTPSGQGDPGSVECFLCRDADRLGREHWHYREVGAVLLLDLVDLRQNPDRPEPEKG